MICSEFNSAKKERGIWPRLQFCSPGQARVYTAWASFWNVPTQLAVPSDLLERDSTEVILAHELLRSAELL